MRNKIWYELVQVKFGEKYLGLYLNYQYQLRKRIKIFTLIFSGSGIFGWKLWEPIAWIALVLITIIQVVSLIENQIVKNDKEILKIAELRELYLKYFNKLEKLWVDYGALTIDEKEATRLFFEYRTNNQEVEALDNELGIMPVNKLKLIADKETRQYLNTHL